MGHITFDPALEQIARCLCEHGPRVTYEALTEIGTALGATPTVVAIGTKYLRLTPEVAHATGADRFPPRLLLVPDDFGDPS